MSEIFDLPAPVERVQGEIITAQGEVITPTDQRVETDYDKTRSNLYTLLQQGQDALNHALEVAKASEHPRAFEVPEYPVNLDYLVFLVIPEDLDYLGFLVNPEVLEFLEFLVILEVPEHLDYLEFLEVLECLVILDFLDRKSTRLNSSHRL